jgi:hypothetical protein
VWAYYNPTFRTNVSPSFRLTLFPARVISSTPKMEATRSSETLVYNKPTRSHFIVTAAKTWSTSDRMKVGCAVTTLRKCVRRDTPRRWCVEEGNAFSPVRPRGRANAVLEAMQLRCAQSSSELSGGRCCCIAYGPVIATDEASRRLPSMSTGARGLDVAETLTGKHSKT